MEDNKCFYIENNGTYVKASIITNFEIYGDNYCLYTLPVDNSKNNNIYCAKLINNNLIRIVDEQEQERVNKIIKELIKL